MTAKHNDSNQRYQLSGFEISKNIKLLRRPLSSLTNAYNKPISSILPEERKVEQSLLFDDIEIEDHYDHFSGWEGSISKKKIRDWLNQFETTLDKNIAHLLLSKFQFFPKRAIEEATRSLQQKLLNLLIQKEILSQKFYSDPKSPVKNEVEFQKWLRNKIIRYAMLPSAPDNAVESQHPLWAIYERSALTATSSPDGKKFRPLKEYLEVISGEPENSVFAFMDYTNGSGSQLAKCIRDINNLLKEYPAYQNSFFVFMYVVQSKSFSLNSINLPPPNSETLCYEEILYYKSSEIMKLLASHEISEAEYDAFIEKYCVRASGKPSVGYRDSGGLTCHHYSCPNNTLHFFHKPSTNWEPLFRNSQTPSATRYRQS
jgi:hypothetical protein